MDNELIDFGKENTFIKKGSYIIYYFLN